ncbi:MAG: hypothetical protein LBC88_09505, partial [Spirochaetaceae bacterium]|nr:hypothetical protein [Spirochaetaceae bacterium]
ASARTKTPASAISENFFTKDNFIRDSLQENGLLVCGNAARGDAADVERGICRNARFFTEKMRALQEEKADFLRAKSLYGNELQKHEILGGGGHC